MISTLGGKEIMASEMHVTLRIFSMVVVVDQVVTLFIHQRALKEKEK